MKKSKALLVSLLLAMGTMAAVGCGGKKNNNKDSSVDSSITSSVGGSSSEGQGEGSVSLDKTTAEVDVFGSLVLIATTEGTGTLVWSSSNPAVATVDGNGNVTPVGVGTTEITAQLSGGESAICTVTVTAPSEEIELDASYSGLELEEGKTLQLEPVAYLGAIELSGGVITYSSDDTAVATVANDGTITAVGAGTTNIRVNGTFKGISATELVIPITVKSAMTHDTYTLSSKPSFYANRETEFSLDLSECTYSEIQSVEIGGKEVAFSMEGSTVKISREAMATITGGDKQIVINGSTATGDVLITGSMLNVTFAIGTAEEWDAFGAACNSGAASSQQTEYMYVILTDDIDYGGKNFSNIYVGGYFYGCLDGQGHTINNISAVNAIFPGVWGTAELKATVKNIAFTNVLRPTANGGSLFINDLNHADVENVYVAGKITTYTGSICAGLVGTFNGGATLKNSFVYVDFQSKKFNVVASTGAGTAITNVYGISPNSTGYAYGSNASGVYTSAEAFKADITELPDGFNSFWEMSHGMLVFKSAVQFASEEEVTISSGGASTEIPLGNVLSFTVTPTSASLRLIGDDLTDITVSGNSVSVGAKATEGATFQVQAVCTSILSGVEYTATSETFKVINSDLVNLDKQTVAKNRGESVTADLSSYSVDEILSVTVNSVALASDAYTFDNGTLSIQGSKITASGETTVLINATKGSGYITVQIPVLAIDFAIGTVEEFNAFGDHCNVGGANYTTYTYAILTADIDYAGADFAKHYAGGYFYGYFDGQGHTVNNVKCKNAVFLGVMGKSASEPSVLKNVAFTNILRDTANGGGLLVSEVNNAVIDNVYATGRLTAYSGGAFGGLGQYISNSTISNVVIHIDMASKAYNVVTADGRFTKSSISNVYGISSNSTGKMYDDVTEGLYTSMDAFKAEVTAVPASFDSNYWTIVDGVLMFKTSDQYVVKSLTLVPNEEGTTVEAGAAISFTADSKAILSLEAVDGSSLTGITLSGSTVSVSLNAVAGSKFIVKASYFDMIAGKTISVSSEVYTVNKSAQEVTLTETAQVIQNRNEAAEIDLSTYNLTDVTSISVGGALLDAGSYTFDSGKLTILASAFKGLNAENRKYTYTMTIMAESANGLYAFNASIVNIDFAIGTAKEWSEFGDYCNVGGATRTGYVYVILTDDIDYGGENFSAHYKGGYFYGYLDGQGHTINNIKVQNAVFVGLYGESGTRRTTVKNIAFTNILRDTTNGGGTLANDFGYTDVDNVYVTGKFTGGATNIAGFSRSWNSSELVNSVIHVNFVTYSNQANAISKEGEPFLYNVYAISPNSNGYMYGTETEGLYTSMDAFKADVTEVPDGFNAEYWTIHNGVLMFKSAVKYIYAGELSITTEEESTDIERGSSIEFTVSEGATLQIVAVDGSSIEGIELSGTTLSIAATVAADVKFKVVANYYDMIAGPLSAESQVYTVIAGAEVVILSEEITVMQNRKVGLELDLSNYNLTELTEVTVNGSSLEYTFADGKLSIAYDQFTTAGQNALIVRANAQNKEYMFSGDVLNVTYAIGTVEEFNAWGTACNVGNGANSGADFVKKTSYMYVILTADIDYNNASFSRTAYWSGYFYGTFDGQGHTVSNLKVAYGVFGGIAGYSDTDRSVVKNVAFVNVDKNETCSGGLLAYTADYATIENVFISGKQTGGYTNTTALGGFIRIVTHNSVISNCVVYFEDTNSKAFAALVPDYTEGSAVSNTYVVSATSWDSLLYKNNVASSYQGENSAHYDTLADFKAGVAELGDFDANYWTYDATCGLIFKSTLATMVVENYEISSDSTETTLNVGDTLNLTTNGGLNLETWAITAVDSSDITGISVNGGVVTIGSTAKDGAKFCVTVSFVDFLTGETISATSVEYTISNPAVQVTLSETAQVIQNRSTSAEIDLSSYNVNSVSSVAIDDAAIEGYAFANGKLTIPASALAGLNATNKKYAYTLAISAQSDTAVLAISGSIENVDYAIGTAEEFSAFGDYCNVGGSVKTGYVYVILTDDIDYGGANFSAHYTGGYFYGLFDGQGHTINNVKAQNGVFAGIYGYSDTDRSVIKNVAFTNILRDTANGGALFTNAFTNATMENIYVTGKLTLYTGGLFGGLVGSFGNNAKANNVVIHVDMQSKAYPVVSGEWKNTSGVVENVYGISSNSNGYMYSTNAENLYTSTDAFKTAITEVPASFDSNYWTMVNGVLMFKTAAQYTVTEITLTPDTQDTTISSGNAITFTMNANATLKVEGDTTGITVSGNVVTVGVNAVDGGKFTVVATYTDLVMGTVTATSVEYTVSNVAQEVTLTETAQVIQNRNTSAEIDLSSYNVNSVSSVMVGGTVVEGYTFENGKLTVPASALAGLNATANTYIHAISILGQSDTAVLAISGSIENVDYALGTAEELSAFNTAATTYDYRYVIVTDDIDYNAGTLKINFAGVFDGQGHTINNVKSANGIFNQIGASSTTTVASTIKNIAFTNADRSATHNGGIFARIIYNTTLQDVYLTGKISNSGAIGTSAGIATAFANITMKNVVINADFTAKANALYMLVYSATSPIDGCTFENVYGISSNSKGYMYGTVTDGLYTSEDDFKAAVTEIPEGFNTEYWEIGEEGLIFKSVSNA